MTTISTICIDCVAYSTAPIAVSPHYKEKPALLHCSTSTLKFSFLTTMLPILLLAVSSLPPLCGTFSNIRATQSVAAAGQVQCKGKPAKGVHVYLVSLGLIRNSLLASDVTDCSGHFYLTGSKRAMFDISPAVVIQHKCSHKSVSCKRMSIPKEYIAKKGSALKTYYIRKVDLDKDLKSQRTPCFG